MRATARALVKLEQLEPVLRQASPALSGALRAPEACPWWPGTLAIELTTTLAALGGVRLVERVSQQVVAESLSGVLRPLLSAVAAVMGLQPSSVFLQFGRFAQSTLKGVSFGWAPSGATTGTLTIEYPCDVAPEFVGWWLGSLAHVWLVTRREGHVSWTTAPRGFTFSLSWSPK
ncbi:MAG: hypothetical protein ACOZQL_23760 [Myxococcota bacterium]